MFAASAVTAGWAAVVSFLPLLVPVLVVWLVDGQQSGSALTALRFAGAGWLLGNTVGVSTDIGTLGLPPLLLTALIGWRLVRAGRHTTRAVGGNRRAALSGAFGVAVAYGILAAIVALLVSTDDLSVSPVWALCIAGLLALVAAGAGAVYESGMAAHIADRLPPAVRQGLRGGVCAVLALLALGALAAGAALAVHAHDAAGTLASYHAGPVGDTGLTLLCLAYAPNLAVWGVGYLAGPGFAVGVGTHIGVADVHLTAVPALPVLSGLPTAALPAAGGLLLAVPPVVGMAVGLLLSRGSLALRPGRGAGPAAARRAGAGPAGPALAGAAAGGCTAVLLAGAAGIASGPVGSGALATVGASWWQMGLAGGLAVGAGCALSALAARWLAAHRRG